MRYRFSKPKSWKEAKQRLLTPIPIHGHYLTTKEAMLIVLVPNLTFFIIIIGLGLK